MTSNGINALKVIDSLNLTIGDKCSRKWHGMKVKIIFYMVLCAYGWSSISSLRECLIGGLILSLHLLCDRTSSDAKLP